MKRQAAPRLLILIALPLFLMAEARETRAQCSTLESCRERVRLLTEITGNLERELEVRKEAIRVRDERLATNDRRIAELEDQVRAAQRDTKTQADIAAAKQQQIDTYEKMHQTMLSQIDRYEKIVAVEEERIKDRDAAIQALVQVSRRSALEKLAESIPSVASIIALALVNR